MSTNCERARLSRLASEEACIASRYIYLVVAFGITETKSTYLKKFFMSHFRKALNSCGSNSHVSTPAP